MTYYIVLIICVVVSVVSGCGPSIGRQLLQKIAATGLSTLHTTNYNYDRTSIHISRSELRRSRDSRYNVDKRFFIFKQEGHLPSLNVTFDDVITSAKCRDYVEDKEFKTTLSTNTNTLTIYYELSYKLLSSIWECQVTSVFGNSIFYIEIYFEEYKLYQRIFVNRVALAEPDSLNLSPEIPYYYQSGDTVNITCINRDYRCKGQIIYETAEGYGTQTKTYTNVWNFVFHKKLQTKDNNTRIYCISKCLNSKPNITAIFLEKSHSDRNIFVIINGDKVLRIPHSRWLSIPYYVSYAYFVNDDFLNITCDARELGDVKIQSYCHNCEFQDQEKIIKRHSSFLIKPHQLSKIVFNITQNNAILEQIVIFFTKIPAYMSSNPTRSTLHATSSTYVTTPVMATTDEFKYNTNATRSTLQVTSSTYTTTTPVMATTDVSTSATSATYTTSPVAEEQGSVITIIIVVVVIIIVLSVSVVVYKMKMRYCYKQIRSDSNHDRMDTIQYNADIPISSQRDDDTHDPSQPLYDYACNETAQNQDHLYDYPILKRRDQCPVPQNDASKTEYDYASPFG